MIFDFLKRPSGLIKDCCKYLDERLSFLQSTGIYRTNEATKDYSIKSSNFSLSFCFNFLQKEDGIIRVRLFCMSVGFPDEFTIIDEFSIKTSRELEEMFHSIDSKLGTNFFDGLKTANAEPSLIDRFALLFPNCYAKYKETLWFKKQWMETFHTGRQDSSFYAQDISDSLISTLQDFSSILEVLGKQAELEEKEAKQQIEKLKQTEKEQLETICKLVKELDETKEALDEAKETIKAYQETSLNPSEEDKKRADSDCEKLINKIIEER